MFESEVELVKEALEKAESKLAELCEVGMTDLEVLKSAFLHVGLLANEVDERESQQEHPVPHAVKYLALGVAHLHFDVEGKFLGTECNGDGTFVPSVK